MSETADETAQETSKDAPRGPPKVELVVQDPAAARPGVLSTLKGAFAVGLMGAGLFGAAGTFLGRKLVTWSGAPEVLGQCKESVSVGVTNALDSFLLAQGIAMGSGFLLLFAIAFTKLRGRARQGH